MKALLFFLLALWFFGVLFFVNRAQANNCGVDLVVTNPSIAAGGLAIISFEYYNHKPDTSSAFHLLKDSLVREVKETDKLKIIGHFSKNEEEADPQLGYKRANAIRTLFLGVIDPQQIEIESSIRERDATSVSFEVLRERITQNALDTPIPPMMDMTQEVELVENKSSEDLTSELEPSPVVAEVNKEAPAVSTKEEVPVSANTSDYIIYFDDETSNIIGASEVQQYIDALSMRVKASKEKIEIIGYDDNNRPSGESLELAKRRTWRVRRAFSDNFVRRKLVKVNNVGQTNPIAPNNTEEGRSRNRRVEIRIIKN